MSKYLTPAEIRPLIMAARKAYDFQRDLGNIADDQTFDQWRKIQCLDAVNQPGLRTCVHADFRPLLAHFQLLAGDDGPAFKSLISSGKKTTRAAPEDTQEARRQIAFSIQQSLTKHAAQEPHVLALGNKPIGPGYLVYLARQKTQRPDLTLGGDLPAALADRCTVIQLRQLLYTLNNRIAAAEGRGSTKSRDKSQRAPKIR